MFGLTDSQRKFLKIAFDISLNTEDDAPNSPLYQNPDDGGVNPLFGGIDGVVTTTIEGDGNGTGGAGDDGAGKKEPAQTPTSGDKIKDTETTDLPKQPLKLDDARISDGQAVSLKAACDGRPNLYATAVGALVALDGGKNISADPVDNKATFEKTFVALNILKAERDKNRKLGLVVDTKTKDVNTARQKKATAESKAAQDEKAATEAWFQKDTKSELAQKSRAAADDAAKELETAEDALKVARDDVNTQTAIVEEANKKLQAEKNISEKAKDKRELLYELEHGALSQSAKPKLDDKETAILIKAFGDNPAAGREALKQLGSIKEEDRTEFIGHVGRAISALGELYPGEDAAARRAVMAKNAVTMGARMGKEYIDGFDAYFKTDAVKKPDPSGGLEPQLSDTKAEALRLSEVCKKRTTAMAGALLGDGDTLDLKSVTAKAAMDDMLYHPGSLQTFTPEITAHVQKSLKWADLNKDTADKILAECKKPQRKEAESLVRATVMPVDDRELTSKDTKTAVLSAFLSPVNQGSVGSCASTGPLRALQANTPEILLGHLQKIATTGLFKGAKDTDDPIPVNTTLPPDGGNPVLRGLEFSISTASANAVDSDEKKQLQESILGEAALFGGTGMLGASWPRDPQQNMTKKAAISKELNKSLLVEFDAGNRSDGAVTTGDGVSSNGQFRLHYNPTPDDPSQRKEINDEGGFREALGQIACTTIGAEKGSDKEKKMMSEMKSAIFNKMKDLGSNPWEISQTGAHLNQTMAALTGESCKTEKWMDKQESKGQTAGRTKELVEKLFGALGDSGKELTELGTQGSNAEHAFNFMKNAPGREHITPPNSMDKFQMACHQELTYRKISTAKAKKVFEAYCQHILSRWGIIDSEMLLTMMEKSPDKEMSTAELYLFCDENSKSLQRNLIDTLVKRDLEKPGEKRTSDNIKSDYESSFAKNFMDDIKDVFNMEFPPKTTVLADTNWGNGSLHTFFSIGPDPLTGDLILYRQDDPGGALRPADDFAAAEWQKLKNT